MHRQQVYCSGGAGRCVRRVWSTVHVQQHWTVVWAVYRRYGPASSRSRKAAICVAASAASSSSQPHPSTTAAETTDMGLEVFKALVAEKRFTCTQCGKCCTGDGEVWISDVEAVKIANHLNMPLNRFLAQHTRSYSKVEGFKILQSNLASENRDCTFLRPDNTCAIHAVRPLQCSTYPWWPDLMEEKDWNWEKENVCEGFDHPEAPPTDVRDAARQLKLATIQEYQKRLAYKPSKKQQRAAVAATAVDVEQPSSRSRVAVDINQGTIEVQDGTSSSGTGDSTSSSVPSWQNRLQRLQQLTHESS